MPWNQWRHIFPVYLLAIGSESFDAERKRAVPLHFIGLEGQRIFNTLPDFAGEQDASEKAVTALKIHFQPTVNVVSERCHFPQRKQNHGDQISRDLIVKKTTNVENSRTLTDRSRFHFAEMFRTCKVH